MRKVDACVCELEHHLLKRHKTCLSVTSGWITSIIKTSKLSVSAGITRTLRLFASPLE